jgi:hypothetical protein
LRIHNFRSQIFPENAFMNHAVFFRCLSPNLVISLLFSRKVSVIPPIYPAWSAVFYFHGYLIIIFDQIMTFLDYKDLFGSIFYYHLFHPKLCFLFYSLSLFFFSTKTRQYEENSFWFTEFLNFTYLIWFDDEKYCKAII